MVELVKMFDKEDINALYTALINASHTWVESSGIDSYVDPPDKAVYLYLDKTPKASLVVELVDELKKLGYTINRK